MKLMRYGPTGAEKPGLLDDNGNIRDLSGVVTDIAGEILSDLTALSSVNVSALPVVKENQRLGGCVSGTGKSIYIGLNYGDRVQDGSTKTMVYGVAHLVSYLSPFMTLHLGDVISTGTPPRVGLGFNPSRYLKAGDVVKLGIEDLVSQKQECVAHA